MIITPLHRDHHHVHRRRCSFAPTSLHVYRRSLARRFGLPAADRPARFLDAIASALLRARV
jgi:hypothetical protein